MNESLTCDGFGFTILYAALQRAGIGSKNCPGVRIEAHRDLYIQSLILNKALSSTQSIDLKRLSDDFDKNTYQCVRSKHSCRCSLKIRPGRLIIASLFYVF